MSLINEIKKQSAKSPFPEPLLDEYGWKYYPEVPEGFRQATAADVRNGLFKKGSAFLLSRIAPGHFECHRVIGDFPHELMPFIEAGRVWVVG